MKDAQQIARELREEANRLLEAAELLDPSPRRPRNGRRKRRTRSAT